MSTLIIVGALLLALVLGAMGCSSPGHATEPDPEPKPEPDTVKKNTLSRAELEARLDELAKAPPPDELMMGAMCYDPAGPPATAEYTCPICGEKTQYDEYAVNHVVLSITECRRLAEQIVDVDLRLDERAFCEHCSPGVEHPVLALEIRDAEGKLTRTEKISPNDLKLLVEFFQGSKVHRDSQDFESPLADHLPRIKQLLGSP